MGADRRHTPLRGSEKTTISSYHLLYTTYQRKMQGQNQVITAKHSGYIQTRRAKYCPRSKGEQL